MADGTGAAARKAYHHGDLRRSLIAATRALVEEKGAAGFSVAEAARRAGVSTAAPYRHFKDREEMLDAVAEDGFHRLSQRFSEAAAPFPVGSVDALTALGLAYVDFALAEPAVFRLMFAEHLNKSEAVCAAGEGCKGHLLCHVAARIGRAELDREVYAAALPLWTMVHGISFLRLEGKIGPEDATEDMPIEPILRDSIAKLLPG